VKQESKRRYWWIICKDPDTGKPFLIAGGDTESEARQKGMEMLGGIDFEIRDLPTRNLARASSIIRGGRLEDTHDLRQAKEKLGHNRSLCKLMRKRMGGLGNVY
jgi:hypothetical protein